MDDVDLASDREQKNLNRAVKRIQTNMKHQAANTGPVECEDCGEDIPERRLEALPHARRCIACQTAAER